MAVLELAPDEKERLEAWKREHYAQDGSLPSRRACHGRCNLKPGSAGDLYYFHVCPSGIGTFIAVACPCGAPKCDLTGDL